MCVMGKGRRVICDAWCLMRDVCCLKCDIRYPMCDVLCVCVCACGCVCVSVSVSVSVSVCVWCVMSVCLDVWICGRVDVRACGCVRCGCADVRMCDV